ncbi:MAG TPA: hypothetical protein DCL54_18870 [Alphaproteobacteria bacterium]|nr:hypothetical protein [Alphaproteobacteria bacterium]HAJ48645.1 hypothetical protein [Alphaproteobacteria bacterium]
MQANAAPDASYPEADAALAEDARLHTAQLIRGYDGLAWCLSASGDIVAQSAGAAGLLEDETSAALMRALAADALSLGEIKSGHFTPDVQPKHGSGQGPRRFEVLAIPGAGEVMLIARDTSSEANLIAMLKASRALFRDVAMCNPDFAFEVDAAGQLTWVSPHGGFGYRPEELVGAPAAQLLKRGGEEGLDPFASRTVLERQGARFAGASGETRTVEISAVPVINAVGTWKGVRGVAKDVTETRRQINQALLHNDIVAAMQAAPDGEAMLSRIATLSAQVCGAEAAWIKPLRGDLIAACAQPHPPCDLLHDIAERAVRDASDQPLIFSSGTWSGLALPVPAAQQGWGAILIASACPSAVLDMDVLSTLRAAQGHLGLALAQHDLLAKLQAQADTDPVTGLANETAFKRDFANRLRGGKTGVLALMRCDYVKAIGDSLGQDAADRFLRGVAVALKEALPVGGGASRLRHDEFAFFLAGMDLASASQRIDAIMNRFSGISRQLGLALSATPRVGLVPVEPGACDADTVLARASVALHTAKQNGRTRPVPIRASLAPAAQDTEVLACSGP